MTKQGFYPKPEFLEYVAHDEDFVEKSLPQVL